MWLLVMQPICRRQAVIEGDEIVLNGRKWWSSGLGDPNAKIIIFMAHTSDEK